MRIRELLCAGFDVNTNIEIFDGDKGPWGEDNLVYQGFGSPVDIPDHILDMDIRYMTTHGDCIVIEGESQKESYANTIADGIFSLLWNDKPMYIILQVRSSNDDEVSKVLFSSMRELDRMGMQPNVKNYDLVYHSTFESDSIPYGKKIDEMKDTKILEYLFQEFNVAQPKDYKGRSMSVSDVVILRRNRENKIYFVDSIGFKKLTNDFFKK